MFKSNTYGSVEMHDIVRIVKNRIIGSLGNEFNIMVGTDSQNFDKTKVVSVIALHEVGHGGIFFYKVTHIHRINNVSQKLLYETQLSLDCAKSLIDAFVELEIETGFEYEKYLNFCIHVDAGINGPSKQVIPEVVGWIKSCGYDVSIKPESVAASSIANKYSK